MSFAGHVFDMISRMRQNREMLKSKKEKRDKVRDAYFGGIDTRKKTLFQEKEIAQEEIDRVRDEIREKIRKERRLDIIVAVFAFAIGAIAIGYMFYYWL